ncbi:MAG: hypothetical protein E7263_05835 [Lachnospiraceae bacterium]|nr:hypothetical protein [Lachnospiraceae bacterium]
MNNSGVYKTKKKDGTTYYRSSFTYKGKHISLGSYSSDVEAHQAYLDAKNVVEQEIISLNDYGSCKVLPHDKFISLINYRDNGIYISTPIYIRKQYFEYYLDCKTVLKFDRDDLFFYASHKIQRRGGYLFVSDYGSQYKILSRLGIKPFAVYGRDYIMANGDQNDYRYSNILIINSYIGVRIETKNGISTYAAYIHVNGDYLVGKYDSEIKAAIAYNKAADTLNSLGFEKAYLRNYITSMKSHEYKELYNSLKISRKLYHI